MVLAAETFALLDRGRSECIVDSHTDGGREKLNPLSPLANTGAPSGLSKRFSPSRIDTVRNDSIFLVDTILLHDTLRLHDTVYRHDTTFIRDTLIDTQSTADTVCRQWEGGADCIITGKIVVDSIFICDTLITTDTLIYENVIIFNDTLVRRDTLTPQQWAVDTPAEADTTAFVLHTRMR